METARLGNFTVSFPNSTEFHELKREIFSQHIYYLDEDLEKPYIIDVGAHIGLTVLYLLPFQESLSGSKVGMNDRYAMTEPGDETLYRLRRQRYLRHEHNGLLALLQYYLYSL